MTVHTAATAVSGVGILMLAGGLYGGGLQSVGWGIGFQYSAMVIGNSACGVASSMMRCKVRFWFPPHAGPLTVGRARAQLMLRAPRKSSSLSAFRAEQKSTAITEGLDGRRYPQTAAFLAQAGQIRRPKPSQKAEMESDTHRPQPAALHT